MKIAVIAAGGRSGRVFVQAAVASGHVIRAGVRNIKDSKADPRVEVVQCDATKLKDLRNLCKGQDAVVSFIGHVKGSPSNIQTRATENIVEVMRELQLQRFVSLTGTGVRMAGDNITLMDRFLNAGIKMIDPKRVKDGVMHVDVLKDSDLDWTVIRVLKLQNGGIHSFVLRENGPPKSFVSRREVAQACLQVLEDESFIRQAPMISPR